ncbi:MAG: acyltransferase [Deltaproteobacteria bacterium]|nr:acyltransferase [Deltaproteobacteria bacterium]
MIRDMVRLAEKQWQSLNHQRWQRRMDSLIAMGLKIGKNVVVESSVYIDQTSPFLIEIGDNCALAHGVRILAHDATPFRFLGGYTRLGKVHIKDNCFIAEDVIVLPGVTIGPNALVAAGSVVNKDIPPNSCVAGVPARFYAKFDEMLQRHKEAFGKRPIFERQSLYFGDPAEKERCKKACEDGDCYVRGFAGTYPFTVNPVPGPPVTLL